MEIRAQVRYADTAGVSRTAILGVEMREDGWMRLRPIYGSIPSHMLVAVLVKLGLVRLEQTAGGNLGVVLPDWLKGKTYTIRQRQGMSGCLDGCCRLVDGSGYAGQVLAYWHISMYGTLNAEVGGYPAALAHAMARTEPRCRLWLRNMSHFSVRQLRPVGPDKCAVFGKDGVTFGSLPEESAEVLSVVARSDSGASIREIVEALVAGGHGSFRRDGDGEEVSSILMLLEAAGKVHRSGQGAWKAGPRPEQPEQAR